MPGFRSGAVGAFVEAMWSYCGDTVELHWGWGGDYERGYRMDRGWTKDGYRMSGWRVEEIHSDSQEKRLGLCYTFFIMG